MANSADREIIMPVPGSEAALQFFTEAMRQNTSAIEGFRGEMREMRGEVKEVREGMIRVEAANHAARLETVEKEIAALKADKNLRDGATGALATLWKNLPSIAAFFVAIAVIAFLFAKATGRIPQ